MKKVLFTILAIVAFSVGAQAQVGTSFLAGNIAYTITSDSTVEVGQKGCVAGTSPYSGAVTIPATVTRQNRTYTVTAVGEAAFFNCNVSSVTLPGTIGTLKTLSFFGANNLSSLTLPSSVSRIERYALVGRRLSLQVDPASPYLTVVEGVLYSKDTATLVVCPQAKSGALQLPSGVECIAVAGFYNCDQLTSIALPPSLQEIGEMAFAFCSRLNNLVVPSSVRRIDVGPFLGCTALTSLAIAEGNSRYVMQDYMIMNALRDSVVSCHKSSPSVTLPSSVRYVGGFQYNTSLAEITLPESVDELAHNAFEGCTELSQVAMPQRMSLMGKEAFYGCENLTAVRIADGLRVVDTDAFHGCAKLAQVEWGDTVERIEYGAFLLCKFSQRLELPPTLRYVGTEAFGVSSSPLRQVVFTSEVDSLCGWVFSGHRLSSLRLRNLPETDEYGALSDCTLDSLIIPCGMRAQFEAHPYWGQFASKLYEDCSAIGEPSKGTITVTTQGRAVVVLHAEDQPLSLYDITGRHIVTTRATSDRHLLPVPAPGVYILRTTQGAHKIVVD